METFAWIGVGLLALLVIIYFSAGLIGMFKDPIGRAIIIGLSILAVIAWGITGGIYLIAGGS